MLQETELINTTVSDDSALAKIIGELLFDHKGADVITLDLREAGVWTDFFIITTVSSNAHMDGLDRHIKEFCRDRDIAILRRSRKPENADDEWRIIDLGTIVIHLMSRQARSFYDLERLYSIVLADMQPSNVTVN